MDKLASIGVFDSGVGGLSVLKKLVELLPNENYLYFGDTARIPYGEKCKEQLLTFSREILNWFKQKRVKAVAIACNTSSAVTLETVKNEYDFPIWELIQPTANYVANLREDKIGLIATSATVNSKAYSKAILNINPKKSIIEVACPGLVEVVESGKTCDNESRELVNSYIKRLLIENAEKIILGCTHYPYLTKVINSITNKSDMIIDPAEYMVRAVKNSLEDLDLLNDNKDGIRSYYVSANPDKFVQIGSKFFADCTFSEKIDLNSYSK